MALPYKWQWRLEQWKAQMRSFFGGGDQQRRPGLCPSCGTLVGINATKCHQCGTNLRFSMAAVTKKFSGLFGGHDAPASAVLLMANVVMFIISWILFTREGGGGMQLLWGMGGEGIYRLGSTSGFSIFYEHQWYRLITAMFLHGGLIHIGFNMMSLIQLGPALEEVYGSARFLFLYVVTGAFGFLVSGFLLGHAAIGASGALLGLVGLMLAITTKRGGAYMRELRARLVTSVIILFFIGFSGLGIDNYAHAGGLAAGFVLGKLFADRQPMNPSERQTAYVLGWLAGIAIVASFALMIIHFHDPLPWKK